MSCCRPSHDQLRCDQHRRRHRPLDRRRAGMRHHHGRPHRYLDRNRRRRQCARHRRHRNGVSYQRHEARHISQRPPLDLCGGLLSSYVGFAQTTAPMLLRREQRERHIFYAPFTPFVLPSGTRSRQKPHPRTAHTEFSGLNAHKFFKALRGIP